MSIVKLPKKLRDVFDVLRNGEIESGIEKLANISGFEPQKEIALAEVCYFKENFEEAMTHDENALPYDEQWYAGNVLSEHFVAYTKEALLNNSVERARSFMEKFLDEKQKLNLPDHMIKRYENLMKILRLRLVGENDTDHLITIKTDDFVKDGYLEQLKKFRPKLTYDSGEGASYLLHFMFEKANTIETLKYYETWAKEITNVHFHLYAARYFNLLDEKEKSSEAILKYAQNWYPVENIQIAPMGLFEYNDILPILTKELKEKILYMSKAVKK